MPVLAQDCAARGMQRCYGVTSGVPAFLSKKRGADIFLVLCYASEARLGNFDGPAARLPQAGALIAVLRSGAAIRLHRAGAVVPKLLLAQRVQR